MVDFFGKRKKGARVTYNIHKEPEVIEVTQENERGYRCSKKEKGHTVLSIIHKG